MGDISQTILCLARVTPAGATLLGTAFGLGGSLLGTAAHVVSGDDRDLVALLPAMSSLADYQDTTKTDVRWTPVRIKEVDTVHDLCVLELIDAEITVGNTVGSADDLPPGRSVYLYGFPHADAGRFVLTQTIAYVGARVLAGTSGGLKSK